MMKKLKLIVSITLFFFILTTNSAFTQSYSPAHPYSDQKLLQDFLCSEVIYPEKALEQGVEGKVVIAFRVEKDGSISNVRIKQSAGPELDAEAGRLFSMLLWEPAINLGQPAASENEFPIDFNIKKYNKHCKARGYMASEYPFSPVDSSNIVYDYAATDKKPYAVFDEKGMKLGTFISKNIRYPEVAYKQSLSGKVTLEYVVELHGRVSNIKVLAPVGGGCTQEAIRLLQMIRWMPGIKNDKAVRTLMKIDIDFKLPEKSDMEMFENSQMNSN
jgi:TonB family protein